MIDPDYLDQMFEAGDALPGGGPLTALFDKRVLLPLEALPRMVANETGETLDPARIASLAKAGWFSILSSDVTGTAEGFPFYIPGRIGLFLRLERDGVSSAELAAFAEEEEQLIDLVLVNDEMPYDHDDDIRLVILSREEDLEVIREEQGRLHAAQQDASPPWLTFTGDLATPEGRAARLAAIEADVALRERELETLAAFRARGMQALKPETQKRLRREAFHVRFLHESTRVMMVQSDRAQLAAGFSHFLRFRRHSWNGIAPESFTFEDIDWEGTLRSPWLEDTEVSPALPLRLPGVVIRGESLTFARRTTPAEYKRLASLYDLDGYFRTLARLKGERLCRRCLAALPADASERRRYCGETCRSAARAENFRSRHPDWRKADRHGLPRDMLAPPRDS